MISLRSKLQAWIRPMFFGLLVFALAAYFLAPAVLGPRVAVELVARGDVVRTVVASGRIQTPFRVEIGSLITGAIASIPVDEGQFVHRDQLLIQMENSEALANVELAEAAVAQTEARLQQIVEVILPVSEEALHQAEANLLNAQGQHERANRLHASGHATQAQLDEARRALNVAQAQVRAARFQANSNRPGGMDYVVAETSLRQAKATLVAARSKLDYTSIEAPADGTLISRSVERGDVVQPGKTLMILAPTGETQVVVQIDEKNLGLLAVGQRALVSADAYPDKRCEGELIYINPAIDPQRASVEIKLRVLNPPDYLRQDMTVSVDIEASRHDNTLVLSAGAVNDLNGPRPWVAKVTEGRIEHRPVKIGAKGDRQVEILEGLKEGDRVAPTAVKVPEHHRIRAVING